MLQLARQHIKSRRRGRIDNINTYEQSIYSQNGEDGIIKELFFRAGTSDRYFVEFGVGTGEECNAALLALRYSWHGLMIESDVQRYSRLREFYSSHEVLTMNRLVSLSNIENIFKEAEVPVEFDLLSIDIDGNDYWIWERLHDYRPRIVVVEYNAAIPPPVEWVMPYDSPDNDLATMTFGASLQSYQSLGNRLGYALIGTERRGGNAFFVRRDLLRSVNFPELSAVQAYHRPRYGFFGLACAERPVGFQPRRLEPSILENQ